MNNETLEKYVLQNRAQLASISELLNRNMRFAGSNNASYVNSTTAMPIGFNSPNLFSQLTGMVDSTLGEGAGAAMGMMQQLSANPQVQQMLPQFIAQPLAMMQTAAPIGGVANAGDFFYASKFRSLGRNIPRTSLPISFENRAAVDLYNEQQKQLQEYFQSIEIADLNGAGPLEVMPSNIEANSNLGKTIDFRNVLKIQSSSKGANLFRGTDAGFEDSEEYKAFQAAKTEEEAKAAMNRTYKDKLVASILQEASERFNDQLKQQRQLSYYQSRGIAYHPNGAGLLEALHSNIEANSNLGKTIDFRNVLKIQSSSKGDSLFNETDLDFEQSPEYDALQAADTEDKAKAAMKLQYKGKLVASIAQGALERFNDQLKQKLSYEPNGADPLEALPSDRGARPNLGKTIDFRNVLKMQRSSKGASLFNETDAGFEDSGEYRTLQAAKTEDEAIAAMESTYNGRSVASIAQGALERFNDQLKQKRQLSYYQSMGIADPNGADLLEAMPDRGARPNLFKTTDLRNVLRIQSSSNGDSLFNETDPGFEQSEEYKALQAADTEDKAKAAMKLKYKGKLVESIVQGGLERFNDQLKQQQKLSYEPNGADPLEALPSDMQANSNLGKTIGFRNVLKMRGQESSFKQAFTMFNEMDIFGSKVDTDFEQSPEYDALQAADTEDKAKAAMQLKYKGKLVESIVQGALDRGRMSTGLLSAAEMLSSFTGGSAGETAGIQSLGDLISNVFMLEENKAKFMIGTAQTIGGIGNLALTSTAPDPNNPSRRINAADQLTAALAGRINTTDPKASYNPYTSLSDSGFAKSSNLMGELSRSGLVSTGGVDIFGALGTEDVKQMEKAMLLQMEGMSEVAKVGRRMGINVKDVIQNLQGVYGGGLNEELSRAADTATIGFNAVTTQGSTVGDDLVKAEEKRRGTSFDTEGRVTFLQEAANAAGGVAEAAATKEFNAVTTPGSTVGDALVKAEEAIRGTSFDPKERATFLREAAQRRGGVAADTATKEFNAVTTPGSTVGDALVKAEEAIRGKSFDPKERATFLQVEAQRRGLAAADTATIGFNAVTTQGSTVGDDLVKAEEKRIKRPLGVEERATFLQVEAQRRGGVTLMKQLEEAVEVGRLAGVDTKGVMAVATTATQMLSNLGMTGSGSLALTEDALARVALSRNTGGTPITTAQSLALSGGIMQKALENDDVIAYSVMQRGIASGILDANDPAVQAQIDAFKNNKPVEIGAVRSLFAAKGVNMDPYLNASNIAKAVSESTPEILRRYATDKNLSVGGALERALAVQIKDDTKRTQAISDAEAALGISGQGMLGIQHAIDVQGEFAVRAAMKKAGMSDDSINPFIAVHGTMTGLVGDDPVLQGLFKVRTEEELQFQQTGLTTPQIAAKAKVSVTSKFQDHFTAATTGSAGDAFTAGLAQATTAAVEAEAERLAATNPTKYQAADGKPNQAAKDAAKASVAEKGLSLPELMGALGGISPTEVEKFRLELLEKTDADIKNIGAPDTKEKRQQLAILAVEKAQLQITKPSSLKTPEARAQEQNPQSDAVKDPSATADTKGAATTGAAAKGAATTGASVETQATDRSQEAPAQEAEAAAKVVAPTPVTVTVNMDKGFQTAIEAQSVTLAQMKDTLCGIQTNLANVFG